MDSPGKDDLIILKVEAETDETTKSSRLRSSLWNFYKCYENSQWAKCMECNRIMKKSAHSNLRKHLRRKHPASAKKLEKMSLEKMGFTSSIPKTRPNILRKNATPKKESPPESEDEPMMEDVGFIGKRKSFVWQHYQILNQNNQAQCRFCKKCLSIQSISNLKKHLIKKHPSEVSFHNPTVEQGDARQKSRDSEVDNVDDDINFSDDIEDVKAFLGLTGAQVEKTIEIIEHVDTADGNHYNMSYDGDNYVDEFNNDDDELTVKKTAKPVLQRCLAAVKKESAPPPPKKEDNIDVLVKNIENKLRMMNLKQQVIAEYKIHEILFLGISNQLKYSNEDNEQLTFTIMDVNNEETVPNDVQ